MREPTPQQENLYDASKEDGFIEKQLRGFDERLDAILFEDNTQKKMIEELITDFSKLLLQRQKEDLIEKIELHIRVCKKENWTKEAETLQKAINIIKQI